MPPRVGRKRDGEVGVTAMFKDPKQLNDEAVEGVNNPVVVSIDPTLIIDGKTTTCVKRSEFS